MLLAAARVGTGAETADLVLHNGKIVTVNDDQPEVEALAARGERILEVGSNEQIARLVAPRTRVIDLKGQLAIPGFIEGHGHFTALGRSKMMLDLRGSRNWNEIVQLVAVAAKKTVPGEWIVGEGWHQSKWNRPPRPNLNGYPIHEALSRVTPNHPVLLTHASGHICFANARAMQLSGINRDTKDPDGGQILRDLSGNPIGVFRETAQTLIQGAYSSSQEDQSLERRKAQTLKAIELATDECLSKGITSFQDAGVTFELVDMFRSLADDGRLKLRLWLMLREPNERLRNRLDHYRLIGYGGNRLTVRAIKRMADGALGAHGAWMLEPYADLPTSVGLSVDSPEYLMETALLAAKNDYQMCVHAIGDRANREVLDIFRIMFAAFPRKTNRRWRIEHAQHIRPDDIPRFAELGVIASMQGIHCTSDAPFVIQRLGEKRSREGAYAWRSLCDTGAIIANGTDAPVEDVDPIASFHASVTRRLKDGSTFYPEQRLTRMEALRSYTINSAYAAFEEDLKGSLAPGKLADVVVLSKDILTVSEQELTTAEVVLTIVGGTVMYSKP